jgi:hypothetical protein
MVFSPFSKAVSVLFFPEKYFMREAECDRAPFIGDGEKAISAINGEPRNNFHVFCRLKTYPLCNSQAAPG